MSTLRLVTVWRTLKYCVKHYPEIPIVVPVDSSGPSDRRSWRVCRPDHRRGQQGDCQTARGDVAICLPSKKLCHQYPHCWRCKEPILFRATEQWFCSVDGLQGRGSRRLSRMSSGSRLGARNASTQMVQRALLTGVFLVSALGAFRSRCSTARSAAKCHIDDASIKAVSELFRK